MTNRKGQVGATIVSVITVIVLIMVLGLIVIAFGQGLVAQRDADDTFHSTQVNNETFTAAQIAQASRGDGLVYLSRNLRSPGSNTFNESTFRDNTIVYLFISNDSNQAFGIGNVSFITDNGLLRLAGAVNVSVNSSSMEPGINITYTTTRYADDSEIAIDTIIGISEVGKNMSTIVIIGIVVFMIFLITLMLLLFKGRISGGGF